MHLGGCRRVRRGRPLLPGPLRLAGAALLAACLAVTVGLGLHFAGRERAGWLDLAVDRRVQAGLGQFPWLLFPLHDLGAVGPVALMIVALVLGCLVTRRWSGAVLAAVAPLAAGALTEQVLKPLVGRTIYGSLSFPSGHATGMFALAGVCLILLADPSVRRVPAAVRLLLAVVALLLAAAVAAAMVGLGMHYFTDTVGGAAVGTGMVLACALALDLAAGRARRMAPRGPACQDLLDRQYRSC